MRILGGDWGGRPLVAPKNDVTRPTSDANRERIFNIMTMGRGHEPVRVLDLFAGSGSFAFECLSRGALTAVLVEKDKAALKAIHANSESLGAGPARVHTLNEGDLRKWPSAFGALTPDLVPFDTVFCDPPYGFDWPQKAFKMLEPRAFQFFAENCLLIVEVGDKEDPKLPPKWELADDRKRGNTRLLFYVRRL